MALDMQASQTCVVKASWYFRTQSWLQAKDKGEKTLPEEADLQREEWRFSMMR